MGSPSEFPAVQYPVPEPAFPEVGYLPPLSVPLRREPKLRYIALFLLTAVTTTLAGSGHYASFLVGFSNQPLHLSWWSLIAHGLWYSTSILGILGAHEFGHYFACRYYRV